METTPRRTRRPIRDDQAGAAARREMLALAALGLALRRTGHRRAAAPQGRIELGHSRHIGADLVSTRRETPGIITPFMVLYALHDAMVKPMPGNLAGAEPGRVADRPPRTASPMTSSCAKASSFTTASR